MFRKWFAAGALAAAGVLALASGARAGDVQTLKLTDKTPTLSLVGDGGADTVDIRGHGGYGGYRGGYGGHRGYYGGGYRGGYGGHRGYYGGGYRGGYGGHHGYYGGGYRGYYGGGYRSFYRPYYNDFAFGFNYYRPYYSSYYYSAPSYYYSAPSYYIDPCYPLAGSYAPALSLTIDRAPFVQRTIIESDPATITPGQPLPRADDTYPSDGGPRQPVPMPKADPAPIAAPPVTAPLEGRAVSLPAKLPKLSYPAYGESASPPDDRGAVVKKAPK